MEKYSKTQLEKGIKIELEHTKSRKQAEEIAEEHLEENPNYYKKASVRGKNKLVSVKNRSRKKKKSFNLFNL